MNNYSCYHQSSRRGFTLLELLVVITIIALLASLAMPTYNVIMKKAREVQARAAMTGIVAAVKSYETEYNRLPAVTGTTTGTTDAAPFDTSTNKDLLKCLLAKDTGNTLNPRQIPFYDPPPTKGNSGYDSQSGILNDPWGHPYHVALDTNGDNVIDNPYADIDTPKLTTVPGKVIVYSDGSNGTPMDKDDVKSWR